MTNRLADFISRYATEMPEHTALIFKAEQMRYDHLHQQVEDFASSVLSHGMEKSDRLAIYLPKQMQTIISMFGASAAGGVFVPVNPALKARQVSYILNDCSVKYLVTSADRLSNLAAELADNIHLELIVLTGKIPDVLPELKCRIISFDDFLESATRKESQKHDGTDEDLAAILYTSGSTGNPKGVMLSHRNMIVGAESVASYLKNTSEDRILSVLPLSFDAGLSQLTTAFSVGATVVLMNYLMPRDVIRQAVKHSITGITCVPPLWIQLAELDWPEEAVNSIRYIATTGGRMPVPVTRKFRKILNKSDIYLMYGLTEAFRSTYLPPSEVDRIPESMGKAIPNVEIMLVRPDGSPCAVDEPGELVHLGPLVAKGYWNDVARSAERFKPAPGQADLDNPEIAVWSGDMVKKDADGYLYFVGRTDEMIKTSGFRTSPTELEEVIFASGLVDQVAAIGVDHEQLGQAIWIIASPRDPKGPRDQQGPKDQQKLDIDKILSYCRLELPSYMVPQRIIEMANLPRNPNGKIDRKAIKAEVTAEAFENQGSEA